MSDMKIMILGKMLPGEQTARRIIDLFAKLAGVILVAMMMITVIDVSLRFFFNRPIVGAYEIAVYMMACVGNMGLGWCALKGMHIDVDIISSKFPMRVQAALKSINLLLVAGLCLLIASQNIVQSMFVQKLNVASTLLHIPEYPFYLVTTLSYFLLFLAVVILFVHSVSREAKK